VGDACAIYIYIHGHTAPERGRGRERERKQGGNDGPSAHLGKGVAFATVVDSGGYCPGKAHPCASGVRRGRRRAREGEIIGAARRRKREREGERERERERERG